MKKTTIISSHAAIFALGVGATFFTVKGSEGSGETSSAAGGNPSGVRISRDGISGNGSIAGKRAQREGGRLATGKAGSTSPTESLGMISKIPDAYERKRALMDFYDTLAPDQFAAVADEFQKLNHYGNTGTEMELLFQAWAKADPMAALDYIDENPETGRNSGEVLASWAASDPAAAEKWAVDKHQGDGPNPYMASVIRGIAAYDLPNASRLTANMPLSGRGPAIDAIVKALLMSGTEAAFAFSDTIKDEHLKGSLVMMIAQNLSQKDPQSAADWVVSIENGTVQDRASANIADRLAHVDVRKAADFVNSLKPEAKANAAAATVPMMSHGDIAGTARWVTTLAGTPGYDRVVESFIWSCDERDPEQSAAWIRGISDTNQQTKIYYQMLGNWARKDAVAVRNWVAQNEVPENVRKRFSK